MRKSKKRKNPSDERSSKKKLNIPRRKLSNLIPLRFRSKRRSKS